MERTVSAFGVLGSAGWELVTIYDKSSNWLANMEKGFMLFKRPVPPGARLGDDVGGEDTVTDAAGEGSSSAGPTVMNGRLAQHDRPIGAVRCAEKIGDEGTLGRAEHR